MSHSIIIFLPPDTYGICYSIFTKVLNSYWKQDNSNVPQIEKLIKDYQNIIVTVHPEKL